MRSTVPPAFRDEGRDTATCLWLARAIAWSLLFGGWLALGALGHQAALAGAWPGMPLVIWVASIGTLLAAGAGTAIPMRALAAGLVGAAIVAAGSLARVDGASPLPLVGVACGWAALLVLSSRTVQALRAALRRRTPAPIGPAIAGACIAWAVAGDTDATASRTTLIGLFLLAASLVLVALRPRGAPPASGCRAGLFDCALPLPHRGWGVPSDWPMHAAALSMLPTMAALGPMAQLCAGDRLDPSSIGALHLAAMLVPAWLLRRPLASCPRALLGGIVAALLAAGGLLVAFGAHRDALLAGMLVHAVAWSLAWAGPMLARDLRTHPPPGRAGAFGLALASAALVAALAAAVTASGEQALRIAHLALAAFALGALWPASFPRRGETPPR